MNAIMGRFAMNSERSWISIYCLSVIVFFVSHGLMLLVYGAWWDDMLNWNVSQEVLDAGYEVFNNPFTYIIIKRISQIDNAELMTFVYRLVPFICWLISLSSFFLFIKIISKSKKYTLYSCLLVASCGLNKCMILISCYHYSISIALFMVGLVFFIYDYFKENLFLKLVTAILWLFSLLVWRSAVLVIPSVIVFATISKMRNTPLSKEYALTAVKYMLKQYGFVILGLFIFAFLYKTILAPHGDYAVYYSVHARNVILLPLTTTISSGSLLLGYLSNLFSVFSHNSEMTIYIVVLIISFILLSFLFLSYRGEGDYTPQRVVIWIACLSLIFSMMPHLLREVSYSYDINGYKSRVSALAMFPICMIISYFLVKIRNNIVGICIFCFLVVLSSVYSVNTYLDYEKGWMKNEALACFFKNHDELKEKNIVCIDNSEIYSPFVNEEYRYYDFEGCAKLAYGKKDNTKCIGSLSLKNYTRFDVVDYYLYIDVKEHYSHIGFKSLIYRFLKNHKRIEMQNNMLQFRLIKKDDYSNNALSIYN